MRMRVFMKKLRVEIENETRVYLESLNFEIEMRVSQKSAIDPPSFLHGQKCAFGGVSQGSNFS